MIARSANARELDLMLGAVLVDHDARPRLLLALGDLDVAALEFAWNKGFPCPDFDAPGALAR